jgi:hypothetical protein
MSADHVGPRASWRWIVSDTRSRPDRRHIAFMRGVLHNQIFVFKVEDRTAGQEQPMLLPQLWHR